MDKKIVEELRAQLESNREKTIEQLKSIGSKAEGDDNYEASFPQYGDSMEDNALEVADYTKNLSLERDLEGQLSDIEKALKRIDEGNYGTCSYCGKEIEIERLKIRPESGSCVACKKKLKGLY